MKQTIVCLILASLFLSANGPAKTQRLKPYRIGVLFPGGPLSQAVDGLRDGLKDLGLEEDKDFTLTLRDTESDPKIAQVAAKDFERENFDLLYALATPVITVAKDATVNIPIVFCIGSNPVTGKLVDSFAKPGGRLTGVHFLVRDLTAKRLEILKELLPSVGRVVTFYDPHNRVATEGVAMAREEAKRLGLKLIERQVASVHELRKGLQALRPGEVDAFFFVPDTMVVGQAQFIIDTAKTKKLPTMFQEQSLVAKGGLASYGQNYYEIGRLSAKYTQRVLSGDRPGNLRIETVENVEMAINLRTAKELGLKVPVNLLSRANKVIR